MYNSKELAVIIPTKDRPVQVKRHLQSLVDQSCHPGRVIVVASGQDIKDMVLSFVNELPVEYYMSGIGQIRQRNYGISLLDNRTKLVATMDDDVVYERDALHNMILFWNITPGDTAGVGFNVINRPKHKSSIISRMLYGARNEEPGKIMSSGVATSLTNVDNDINTEWLNGGGTVWRQDILTETKRQEIRSSWAVYEDVIFSYPIGKKNKLFICAASKINIEDIPQKGRNYKGSYFIGKSIALWRLYFVIQNHELSVYSYYIAVLFESMVSAIKAIIRIDLILFMRFAGTIAGLFNALTVRNQEDKVLSLIENI